MKYLKNFIALFEIIVLTVCGFALVSATSKPMTEQSQAIATLEKAITDAADLYDAGRIEPGKPYVARISKTLTMSFSYESFDDDLANAFEQYEQLLSAAEKKPSESLETLPFLASKEKKSKDARIDALMQAEQKTGKDALPQKTKTYKFARPIEEYQQLLIPGGEDEHRDSQQSV